MTDNEQFEEISRIQNEIIAFSWSQVAVKVDKFYIQGKISDDENGNPLQISGNFKYAVRDGKLLKNSDVLTDEEFRRNSDFTRPRIVELHDILRKLQGKSPVRFRWVVDVKTQKIESEWTYYEDLTDQERENDSWENWEGDFAWKAQLEAELAGQ